MEKSLIILVEDDPIQAVNTQNIINLDPKLKDFYCEKFLSYRDALANLDRFNRASLLLIDINLSDSGNRTLHPTNEGIELVNKLHKISPNLPVIYTSAYGLDFISSIGTNKVLTKPITRQALVTKILLVMSQHRVLEGKHAALIPGIKAIEFRSQSKDGYSIKTDTVDLVDILMVESSNGTLTAYTKDKTHVSSHPDMRTVDNFLSYARSVIFKKIFNGFCVNTTKITAYRLGPIHSQGKRKQYQTVYTSYAGRKNPIQKAFNIRNIKSICKKLNECIGRD